MLDQLEDHLLDARSNRPPILMGHSMDGLIALEHALSERPQPDLLVLSSPALAVGQAWQRAVAPIAASLLPKMSLPNGLDGAQLSRDPSVGQTYFADPLIVTKSTNRMRAEFLAAVKRTRSPFYRHRPAPRSKSSRSSPEGCIRSCITSA